MRKKLLALIMIVVFAMPNSVVFAEENYLLQNINSSEGYFDELISEKSATTLMNSLSGNALEEQSSTNPNYQFDATTGTITKYIGSETEITVPTNINGAAVKSIGKNAFSKNTSITKIVLNEGLETIGEGAFAGCTNLVEAYFPNSLKRIEKGAFIKIGATNIVLNEGLEYIGQQAFANCTNLENINLPNSLIEIESRAFLNSKKLSSVITFGSEAKHIAYEIFKTTGVTEIKIAEGSQKLILQKNIFPSTQTSLDIPQNREILISAEAFPQNVEIVLNTGKVEINDKMTQEQIEAKIREKVKLTAGGLCIDKSVPADHSKDIYIPSEIVWNLESLDLSSDKIVVKGAFAEISEDRFQGQECSKAIPTNEGLARYKPELELLITHIPEKEEDYDFDETSGTITKYKGNATEITIPTAIDGVAVKGIGKNAFSKNTSITKVVLNEGLEIIGEGAFAGCTNLVEAYFPNSLKRIEKGAFIKIGATNIVLNEGLEYLGQQAFANCTNLENINIPASLKELGNLVFANTKKSPGKLTGEFIFGSKLGHVGHGVFNYNGIGSTFKVASSGNKLYLHDELFPEENNKLEIPQNREVMVFARAFNSKSDISLDAGEIKISKGMSKEELKNLIESKVLLTSGAAAIEKNSASRENDIYIESKIIWELDNISFKLGEAVVKGSFEKLNFGNDDNIYVNYTKPDKGTTDTAMARLIPTVKLVMEQPELTFTQEDFTYDTIQSKHISVDFFFAITGFTESGKEKLQKTKFLTLPTTVELEENGNKIEKKIRGIGPKAFENMGIKGVQFPNMDGYKEFVIDTASFAGNDIENLILPEGVKVVESFAFKGNKIKNLNLPSTLLKIGSEAFKDNEIVQLDISDEVELIQLDNWSFAGNKIKSVNMPYSVFKTLEFVFEDNVGSDDEPGVVHLFTRNKAHLSTISYMKNGIGQKFILVGKDAVVERESLYKLFKNIAQLNKADFEPEAWINLTKSLEKSKTAFKDNGSNKKLLAECLTELSGLYDEMVSTGVNKKALAEKVNSLNMFNEEIYTQTSFENLLKEIEKAKKLLINNNVTQDEVDKQLEILTLAFSKLELKNQYLWNAEDFTYNGGTVTGYSESGKEKFKRNKNLVIPDKSTANIVITEIGDKAFAMDIKDVVLLTDFVKSPNGLKSVKMPSTIKKIGNEAFIYNAIEEVSLHEGIAEIGNRAFHSNLLEKIQFPDSLTKLGVATFGMNKLKFVKLNNTMNEIPDGTFTMNITLTQIKFPSNIKKIGKSAFVGARFNSIDLTGIEEIGDRAFQANQIEKLFIPSTIKVISKNSFEQNKKWRRLKELTISEGVERIEASAFKSGLLTEVKLPDSLKMLDKNAFVDNMKEDKSVSVVKLYTTNAEHLKFLDSDSYNIIKVEKEQPNIPLPQPGGNGSSQSSVRPDTSSAVIANKEGLPQGKVSEQSIVLRNDSREIKFSDINSISDSEEKLAVIELAKRGILNGTGNEKIEADKGLTRAVILTMLFRIDKVESDVKAEDVKLKDINENQWYAQVVNWGIQNKITQGYRDGTFKPKNVLTLSELASFMDNYLKYKKIQLPKIHNYTENDLINVPDWAKESVLRLLNAEILKINEVGKFDYNMSLTRGESAKLVNTGFIQLLFNLQHI